MPNKRVAITGMAVITRLADTLDEFLAALLAGRSAITRWTSFETDNLYFKIGGDLGAYMPETKLAALAPCLPEDVYRRTRRLVTRAPWSTALTVLVSTDAYRDAGLFETPPDPDRVACIVAGHNLNLRHRLANQVQFDEEPDFIEPLFAVSGLDSDHAACVSEALQVRGALYTTGAACASGNLALRSALDEIRHHGAQVAIAAGAAIEFCPMDVHAHGLMGSISFQSFNDEPTRASRPFDVCREGFVPAQGAGAIILEDLEFAQARGARIYAELLGVEANADGSHLPQPSADGQARCITGLFQATGIPREEVDHVSAHATSTQLGDLTEIRSIKHSFGEHARNLRINAAKSMLGHIGWAAAIVETVATVLQMRAGWLHPSINIDQLDSQVDLDVCRGEAVRADVHMSLKNSFGFGGLNSASLLRRWDG